MKTPRRTLTPREAWIFLGKGLLLIVLAPWAAWAALDEAAQIRLRTALRDLQSKGFDTCIEDFDPPAVSAEENAALFYSAAFAAFESINRGNTFIGCELADFEGENRAELLLSIERLTEVFALLRRARALPQCRFQRNYRRGADPRLPEFGPALDLSYPLAHRARLQAESGRQDEARDSVRDLLSLADRFREEPNFHFQWLRRFLIDRAIRTIGDCSRSAVTEADLIAWRELLPSASILDDSLERGLRADLASTACLLTQSSKLIQLRGIRSWDVRMLATTVDPVVTLEGLDSLQRMRRAVEIQRMPFAEARLAAKALGDSQAGSSRLNLLRFEERSLAGLLDHHAIVKSRLALTRAGLEAELFFLRRGHYPVETTILDEISGRPLVIDLGAGLIRPSGPGPMDARNPDFEDLGWRLLPR